MTTLFLAILGAGPDSTISGDYLEARNCDVWTGPCFQNSEVNFRGNLAVAAWVVTKGAGLEGLAVVAAFRSEGTLGTPLEGKVKAALYIDERATEAQAKRLADLARSLAPKYLAGDLTARRRPIRFSRKGLDADLAVGSEARLATKALCPCIDRICCNEEQAYGPLSGEAKVECAKTIEHAYQGDSLGVRWSEPDRRSAMVGTFQSREPAVGAR